MTHTSTTEHGNSHPESLHALDGPDTNEAVVTGNALLTASRQLDTCGLRCPEPLMMLHQVIRKSASGDIIHVMATDPSTQRDIPKFCLHLGHELLKQTSSGTHFDYWIRKA